MNCWGWGVWISNDDFGRQFRSRAPEYFIAEVGHVGDCHYAKTKKKTKQTMQFSYVSISWDSATWIRITYQSGQKTCSWALSPYKMVIQPGVLHDLVGRQPLAWLHLTQWHAPAVGHRGDPLNDTLSAVPPPPPIYIPTLCLHSWEAWGQETCHMAKTICKDS